MCHFSLCSQPRSLRQARRLSLRHRLAGRIPSPPDGKRNGGARGSHRAAQERKSDGMGAEDEQHTEPRNGDCKL